MVTLKDIALKAGVSVSTVSRVISAERENPASKETTDKIWSLVKELGYRPNQNAKQLVKGLADQDEVKGSIGCIFTSTVDVNNDPFFSCIGLGIQTELRKHGYQLGYALSTYNMTFSEVYNQVIKKPVQGIIVTGRFESELIDFLQKQFKHIVYAGVNSIDGGFDEVICDGYQGAQTALSHLFQVGHKEIGYVGYIPECVENGYLINEHRYKSYCDFLKSHDMKLNINHIIHTELRTSTSYERVKSFLETKVKADLPTAFYCANDATAFGLMKALQEKGYLIPNDIAVIGLDDVEMASFVTPTLSTVSIPRKELGVRAVKQLIDRFETGREYSMRVDIPFKLIIRQSCQ
jgi:DNA-binding LacI/PurR family transcriptional regulator